MFRDASLSKATRRWHAGCATFSAAVGARGAAIWQVRPSLARCVVTVRAHSLRCVVGSRTAKTRRACAPSEVDTRSASSAKASACASQRSTGLARAIARSAPPARPSTAPSPRGSIGWPKRSPLPQDVAQRYSLAQMSAADDTAFRWPCVKRPPTWPHRHVLGGSSDCEAHGAHSVVRARPTRRQARARPVIAEQDGRQPENQERGRAHQKFELRVVARVRTQSFT